MGIHNYLLLAALTLLLLLPQNARAEEWTTTEGKPIRRLCNGSQIRYGTTVPPGFSPCPITAERGAFNRSSPTPIQSKDFTSQTEPSAMSDAEQQKMAKDLRALQEKRDRELPGDMLREINDIASRWNSDPKFRKELLDSMNPEERLLIEQLEKMSKEMGKAMGAIN